MSNYRRRLLLANQTEENLYLYGNSVQEGTPTPDAPINIVSVENPTIKVMGNNLFNNDISLIKQVFYTTTSGTQTSKYGYIVSLPEGTYTVNALSQVPSSDTHLYYIYSVILDENNVAQTGTVRVVTANKPQPQTFTIGKGQRFFIYDGETGGLSEAKKAFSVFDIQLNAGATALEYEPYECEIVQLDGYTLRGVKDYKDRIYTKDGKVWFEQRSALYEISPDASFAKNRDVENLGLQCYAGAVITDNKYFGVPNTAPMAERESGLSTHFRYSERAYGGWGFTDCVFIRVSRLWLLSDNFTTVKEVIQWIADNKVNIIYPLATPIVTEVTGSLAEQILAIDRTKNIYFISENGVQGETEVIEE